MSEIHEILLTPHVTEETMRNMVNPRNDVHKYVFKVAKSATKTEIKDAIEKRFSVKVDSVNTLINRGKIKRVRMVAGKKSNWKKAYITLKAGLPKVSSVAPAATTLVKSLPAVAVVVTRNCIVSSTSSVSSQAFPASSKQLNTIRTVPPASLWSSTRTASAATLSPRPASRSVTC